MQKEWHSLSQSSIPPDAVIRAAVEVVLGYVGAAASKSLMLGILILLWLWTFPTKAVDVPDEVKAF